MAKSAKEGEEGEFDGPNANDVQKLLWSGS